MRSINDQLYDHYQSFQQGIDAIFERHKNGVGYLDGPQLIHCWEAEYRHADKKIFFLGQENFGWEGSSNSIDEMMEVAQRFEHAKSYTSQYWQAVHSFNERVNKASAHRLGFAASNVLKYCSETRGRVTPADERFVLQHLNLLPGELAILQPDVVVFFSGPNYDDSIALQLGGDAPIFAPVVEGIPTRELALVQHPSLPKHTFRTFHPRYLRFARKWNFIQLIVTSISGYSIDQGLLTYHAHMRDLAAELGLVLEEPDDFTLNMYAGFYFYRPEWKWCGIGLEFEGYGAGSFFYGICRKDSKVAVPTPVEELLKQRLPVPDGSTEHWPWWRWSEQRDWSEKTLEEILNGQMKEKIRKILTELLHLLNGAAI